MPQSILTNTAIATAGRITNMALGVLTTAFITRFLGPQQYGVYAVLLSFGVIVQLLADAGLYLRLAREIAARPARQAAQFFSHTVSLRVALLTLALSVGLLLTRVVPPLQGLTLPFLILGAGLAMQSVSQLVISVFQHRRLIWRATAGDLIGRAVQIVTIVSIGAAAATVGNMVAAFALSAGTALLLHLWLLPDMRWRPTINVSIWKSILATSWPLGAMLILNAIYFRVDTLILSLFRQSSEVGWYAVAYRIVESTLFFPAMFGGLLLPRITESLTKNKQQRAGQYLAEGLRLVIIAGALAVVLGHVFAEPIVELVAGREFLAAAPLLQLLSWAVLIMFLGNLFGFTLVAQERYLFLVKLYALLVAVNSLANVAFVPRFGAAAAAWSTIITEALAAGIAGFVVMRALHLKPQLTLLATVLLISIVSALAGHVATSHIPAAANAALVCAIYAVLNIIFKTISPQQLALIRSTDAV